MAELKDIANDFLRGEVDTFVTKDAERENLVKRYCAATPELQEIAAGVVSARHHDVDSMTTDALAVGTSALDVMDHGLIAGMTLVAAAEMGRYGVTVNAIAPVARTRMTEGAFDTSAMPEPGDNSPVVAWLASEEAGDVTGRVIEIEGGKVTVENGWTHGPADDLGRRWRTDEVGERLRALLAQAPAPKKVYGA